MNTYEISIDRPRYAPRLFRADGETPEAALESLFVEQWRAVTKGLLGYVDGYAQSAAISDAGRGEYAVEVETVAGRRYTFRVLRATPAPAPTTTRQRRRQAALDEVAQRGGYETWRKLETAAINGEAIMLNAPA